MGSRAAALLLLGLIACGPDAGRGSADDVPVHLDEVRLDAHSAPLIVLEEDEGPRRLHIWIGISEAQSIARARAARAAPRPNSHDLAKRLVDGLKARVARVVVNDLRDGIFYATLSLEAVGDVVDIDARPSDAIAIALRTGAPIYVRATVFEAADRADSRAPTGRAIDWRPEPGARGSGTPPASLRRTL